MKEFVSMGVAPTLYPHHNKNACFNKSTLHWFYYKLAMDWSMVTSIHHGKSSRMKLYCASMKGVDPLFSHHIKAFFIIITDWSYHVFIWRGIVWVKHWRGKLGDVKPWSVALA